MRGHVEAPSMAREEIHSRHPTRLERLESISTLRNTVCRRSAASLTATTAVQAPAPEAIRLGIRTQNTLTL